MTAEQTTVYYHHDFDCPAEVLFPNFCPIKERDWIENWRCRLLASRSGLIEKGCIFVTDFFPEIGEETWVCVDYVPSEKLAFVRVGEATVAEMGFSFTATSAKTTTMALRLRVTAKNNKGEALVAHLDGAALSARFRPFFVALEHFLRTGELLPAAAAEAQCAS